jgi:hypothetical protein
MVAYPGLSLASRSPGKTGHQEKSKGLPERKGRREGKKIVFLMRAKPVSY